LPLIDCPSDGSAKKRDRIKELLSQGYTKNEIRDIFVRDYGANVLIKPPFSGFSLLAWLLPFVALAGAGFFVKKYLDNQVRNNSSSLQTGKKAKAGQETVDIANEDEEKIKEEMKKYL
jgi:cytochrome c-type biogenesis protein CcmH